jgi:hypothetical protein
MRFTSPQCKTQKQIRCVLICAPVYPLLFFFFFFFEVFFHLLLFLFIFPPLSYVCLLSQISDSFEQFSSINSYFPLVNVR